MNREQLVEKVARVVHEVDPYCPWDELPPFVQRQYCADAQVTVDVLLPQVTTVVELEALPVGAVVATTTGETYTWIGGIFVSVNGAGYVSWDAAETLYERVRDDETPLTVVWLP